MNDRDWAQTIATVEFTEYHEIPSDTIIREFKPTGQKMIVRPMGDGFHFELKNGSMIRLDRDQSATLADFLDSVLPERE